MIVVIPNVYNKVTSWESVVDKHVTSQCRFKQQMISFTAVILDQDRIVMITLIFIVWDKWTDSSPTPKVWLIRNQPFKNKERGKGGNYENNWASGSLTQWTKYNNNNFCKSAVLPLSICPIHADQQGSSATILMKWLF